MHTGTLGKNVPITLCTAHKDLAYGPYPDPFLVDIIITMFEKMCFFADNEIESKC
jgi:hypothetical protein